MNRREFLLAGLAASVTGSRGSLAGDLPAAIPLADMHAHLFFIPGLRSAKAHPLAPNMAAGNATLVAWSLVGDLPWLRPSARGLRQKGAPERGEPVSWFEAELQRIKAHLTEQNLKIALTPEDIDRAQRGEPHVVLSVEGASFVENDLSQLHRAYDLGVRHLQLVHYIGNPLGDYQTAKPRFGGLSDLGKSVVAECNRLGVLVDLAHASPDAVAQALEISKVPMVWSHGSVTKSGKPHWSMPATKARRLTLSTARAITERGGVVGLWTLRSDIGTSIGDYAERMAQLADWLGEDHAAFGTDMNAISNPPVKSYADLQRVVTQWRRQGMSKTRVQKLAMGNYARVLREALASRQA
jgi:membrane dipeptidase